MIGRDLLSKKELSTITPTDIPHRIQSANGVVTIDKRVRVYVESLQLWVWALLMNNCPPALSLGLLCSEEGWTYIWNHGENPVLKLSLIHI